MIEAFVGTFLCVAIMCVLLAVVKLMDRFEANHPVLYDLYFIFASVAFFTQIALESYFAFVLPAWGFSLFIIFVIVPISHSIFWQDFRDYDVKSDEDRNTSTAEA